MTAVALLILGGHGIYLGPTSPRPEDRRLGLGYSVVRHHCVVSAIALLYLQPVPPGRRLLAGLFATLLFAC
jgi:hypothetical protein